MCRPRIYESCNIENMHMFHQENKWVFTKLCHIRVETKKVKCYSAVVIRAFSAFLLLHALRATCSEFNAVVAVTRWSALVIVNFIVKVFELLWSFFYGMDDALSKRYKTVRLYFQLIKSFTEKGLSNFQHLQKCQNNSIMNHW